MSSTRIEEIENGIVRLIIQSGKGNPLTPDLIKEMNSTLDQLIQNPPKVLIIDADGSRIFSGGFALPIIADWERPQLSAFFLDFLEILYKIMQIPCPTITTIEGHAIAGGFILSLASDFRVVKDEGIKLGLSEVDLGVAVPAGARVLLEARTSIPDALWLSTSSELISPTRAHEIKLATFLASNPNEKAVETAQFLAQKPGKGAAINRVMSNRPIIEKMKSETDLEQEAFLDTWFSEEGQRCILQLANKLRGKNS
jgi:enoyl-CoA hydratase/carnithine racemase